MHQHCGFLVLQVPNPLFSHPILEMSGYPAIGDILSVFSNMICKALVCKSPIVSMKIFHRHSSCLTKYLNLFSLGQFPQRPIVSEDEHHMTIDFSDPNISLHTDTVAPLRYPLCVL